MAALMPGLSAIKAAISRRNSIGGQRANHRNRCIGRWSNGQTRAFLEAMFSRFSSQKIISESEANHPFPASAVNKGASYARAISCQRCLFRPTAFEGPRAWAEGIKSDIASNRSIRPVRINKSLCDQMQREGICVPLVVERKKRVRAALKRSAN
jgi:hypothetical protein